MAPGRGQGGLVHEIRQVCAAEPGRQPRHVAKVHRRVELDLAHMHPQDIDAALAVRAVDQHLPVEAAGPKQGGVQDFRAIGGGQDDQTDRCIKAIHLGEQLVQRLLLLVVPAKVAERTARPAQCIQLVDEDDGWRTRARLLEQVTHTCGPHADEHLDELAARN